GPAGPLLRPRRRPRLPRSPGAHRHLTAPPPRPPSPSIPPKPPQPAGPLAGPANCASTKPGRYDKGWVMGRRVGNARPRPVRHGAPLPPGNPEYGRSFLPVAAEVPVNYPPVADRDRRARLTHPL